MNLQGRDLKLDLSGDDVRLLHSHLRRLGYTIPPEELKGAVFGSVTHEVIREFQRQHGLEISGVDEVLVAKKYLGMKVC